MASKTISNPYKLKRNKNIIESPIILIRHIKSQFNKLAEEAKESNSESSSYNARFNSSLVDSDILFQAEQEMIKADLLKNLNIKYILTSPLKRTLITTMESLKRIEESPNTFSEPTVEVHPYLFEKIEDSCDLLGSVTSNKNSFHEFYFRRNKFNIDWSAFDSLKDDTRIYHLKHCRKIIKEGEVFDVNKDYYYNLALKLLEEDKLSYNEVLNRVIDEMAKLSRKNEFIEDFHSTFERIDIVNKRIKEIISNLDKSKDEKLLVVGHSVIFKSWYTDDIYSDTYNLASDSEKLTNCEIIGANY